MGVRDHERACEGGQRVNVGGFEARWVSNCKGEGVRCCQAAQASEMQKKRNIASAGSIQVGTTYVSWQMHWMWWQEPTQLE